MDELCDLIGKLIKTALVVGVLVVGFFFISAQCQLANRQAQIAAETSAACGRWRTHTEDALDRVIGAPQFGQCN